MKPVKAVIPAAGLGTRFLPATKTVPKELLPIVDKPTLLYIIEEILAADFDQVVLVAGRGKTAIEDFFDRSYELEDTLAKTGKSELLKPLYDLRQRMTFISVRQGQALGLGHAVLCAEKAVGTHPFAVLLGDEVMLNLPGKKSGLAQLTEVFTQTGQSTVAVMEVAAEAVSRYGIIAGEQKSPNLWKVEAVVEKPSPAEAPSRMALPGRYVFTPDIFSLLKNLKPGRLNEIQLTDAMTLLAKSSGLWATQLNVERHDAGDKLGYLQANIEVGLRHPEIGENLRQYLIERVRSLK